MISAGILKGISNFE